MGMSLDDIKELNAYHLASMADCACPDILTSPGALMLERVRDAVVEAIEGGSVTLTDFDDSGQLHEIADNAPSVYTHAKWSQFLDLCAYVEEPDGGEWPEDLDRAASVALYQIANRLTHLLAQEWQEGWECPECGDTGTPHICYPGDCRGTDEEKATYAASLVVPAGAVLTGPVDLPVIADPILDLIAAHEAKATPGDETSRFMASMAEVNELEFAQQRRRRWVRWVFYGLALAGLVIAYVVI